MSTTEVWEDVGTGERIAAARSEITAALEGLGRTGREVATTLAEAGIRGQVGNYNGVEVMV